MRRLLSSLLLVVYSALMPMAANAEDPACRIFQESVLAKVLSVLRDTSLPYAKKHDVYVELFKQSLGMQAIVRQVAAGYWNNASAEDRAAFLEAYSDYLAHFYVGAFSEKDMADIVDIKLVKFKEREPRHYLVHIEVDLRTEAPVIGEMYLVETLPGVCHIIDLNAEGIDLIESQREEILSLGEQGGLPFIIKRLKQHTQN